MGREGEPPNAACPTVIPSGAKRSRGTPWPNRACRSGVPRLRRASLAMTLLLRHAKAQKQFATCARVAARDLGPNALHVAVVAEDFVQRCDGRPLREID